MEERIGLSKKDLEDSAGKELLELLVKITEDGALSRDEFLEMRSFLQKHHGSKVNAIKFLGNKFKEIASDNKITKEEVKLFFSAILLVLPSREKREAKSARKDHELEQKELDKLKKDKEKQEKREKLQKEKEEREKAQVEQVKEEMKYSESLICDFDFVVAGTQYHKGHRDIDEGDNLFLIREPQNKHDSNAILICTEGGVSVGYVPRYLAEEMAPHLDNGCEQLAVVKKMLHNNSPVVIVSLFHPGKGGEYGAKPSLIPQKSILSRLFTWRQK